MRLKGKIACVVGAGQTPGETIGNGKATSILFAREGATVLLVDRELDRAKAVEEEIRKEGGKAHSFQADITVEAEVKGMIAHCVKTLGRIDVLHNNVGIGVREPHSQQMDEEVWDRIMKVNVKGMMFCCKHGVEPMRAQKDGSIINVSSIASLCWDSPVAYKTSKAGVNALTQFVALNNAEYGVRCNAILPGKVDTPMAIESYVVARNLTRDAIRRERDEHIPLRRKMGTAWDIAWGAVYLASDESRFMTGQLLAIDGGESARVG